MRIILVAAGILDPCHAVSPYEPDFSDDLPNCCATVREKHADPRCNCPEPGLELPVRQGTADLVSSGEDQLSLPSGLCYA